MPGLGPNFGSSLKKKPEPYTILIRLHCPYTSSHYFVLCGKLLFKNRYLYFKPKNQSLVKVETKGTKICKKYMASIALVLYLSALFAHYWSIYKLYLARQKRINCTWFPIIWTITHICDNFSEERNTYV